MYTASQINPEFFHVLLDISVKRGWIVQTLMAYLEELFIPQNLQQKWVHFSNPELTTTIRIKKGRKRGWGLVKKKEGLGGRLLTERREVSCKHMV